MCSSDLCGNGRVWTDEMREVFRQKQTEFINGDSDVAEEARWRINNYEEEEPPVPVKDMSTIQSNQFVQDGDVWTMCD